MTLAPRRVLGGDDYTSLAHLAKTSAGPAKKADRVQHMMTDVKGPRRFLTQKGSTP
jgi:hypothetical protein